MTYSMQRYVDSTDKGPTEILDHTVNWSDVLEPIEDSVREFTVEIFDGDGTLKIWQATNSAYDTTAWTDGGTAGVFYTVTHTILTVQGRKFVRSVRVRCIKR